MMGLAVLPAVLFLAGVIDLVVSAAIYLYLDKMKKKCAEVRHQWRPVQVKILASRLAESGSGAGALYSAQIRYEYSLEGTRYESDRLSVYPKWSSSSREPHQKLVDQFQAGQDCTGSVNPRNLSESVLIAEPPAPKGLRIVVLILAATGVLTLLLGAGAWAFKVGGPA